MNVGKTSLLSRYSERRFKDTVSTVGGAFYLKQWGPYNISLWDTAGREQFHGLGSMYCRGAAAIILTYDVTSWRSLAELEELFLPLTDSANSDCIFAIVGNKADLTDIGAQVIAEEGMVLPHPSCLTPPDSPVMSKQVTRDDAMALYRRVLHYKGLDEHVHPPAETVCFETSAKTGYNVDALFETLFSLVLPSMLQNRSQHAELSTVELNDCVDKDGLRRAACCV
ncbi:ras-related protein Rab-20-like [Denticeps clupeoides]|uniref:ras-related protein Rab-20-like n=1 Tax=Denticeps clupeoides TaxID=299321 RepID=UPI0010A5A040|nr:ras-related protein Rab-20-like [Denticeps clupeoides]